LAFASTLKLVGPPAVFEGPGFTGETTVEASVSGVRFHIAPFTKELTVSVGNGQVLTVSLDILGS
jgi:hypothetical protein